MMSHIKIIRLSLVYRLMLRIRKGRCPSRALPARNCHSSTRQLKKTIVILIFALACAVKADSPNPKLCGIEPASQVFSDFYDQKTIVKNLGEAEIDLSEGLKITFQKASSGALILPQGKKWDASNFAMLALDIKNIGTRAVSLEGILDKKSRSFIHLKPGQRELMLLSIYRNDKKTLDARRDLFSGMNGIPGGHTWLYKKMDPGALKKIEIRDLDGVSVGQTIQIQSIRGFGRYGLSTAELNEFFPFVDKFGQFKHFDWPKKTLKSGPRKNTIITDPSSYDMADAYVIGLAGPVTEN